jgi:DMSO/TMAO reductase YedYZ molybdopterin-dependent catalytic subunit
VPARSTNLALLGALALASATGVGAVWTGSPRGAWVVIGHGVAGVTVVLLIPWKSRVVRHGIRRKRWTRWFSYVLAVLALAVLASGLGYATGVVRSAGDRETLWWHVAFAFALVPVLLWHVVARPARPRRTDLSRRNMLRAGSLTGIAIATYAAVGAVVTVAALPGARRRFTGSYETGSFAPERMPNTIWLDDTTQRVDPQTWRLTVGDRVLGLSELQVYRRSTLRATLDCTSGWYAEQDWTGVRVADLVRPGPGHRSIAVHSVTGYWVQLPLGDLDTLLLATHVGDRPLSAGHGFPLRLVAPGRRGYWWVKWVDRVELRETPWWWQPPFPVT